jgi:hypothetical protein
MIDALQVFSDAQDINSATTDSTNIVDLDAASPYAGRGYMPRFRAVVNTALTGGGSVKTKLQHCATVGGSYADLVGDISTTATDTASTGAIGAVLLDVGLPPSTLQFIKVVYTKVGTVSAGLSNAFLYDLN